MAEQKRYSQYEEAWNQSEKRVNTELQLARGFQVADVYLNRTYLESFSAAPIVPGTRALMDTTKLRLLEITKIVYDQKEKFTDKLKSVYSALHSLNSAVALLIQSDGDAVRFFIGTRSVLNAAIAGDVLESTLKGNFPGISYCTLSVSETEKMIEEIKKSGIKSLSSVSVVPSMREENFDTESFVQGIEKFIDTMRKAEKVFRFTMSVPLAVRMSPGTIPILTRTASRENSPNCGNCSRRAQSMPSTQGSIIPTIRQSTSIIIIKKIFVCLPRWDSRFSGCQSTGLVSIPQEWKKNPIGRGWSFTGTSSGN